MTACDVHRSHQDEPESLDRHHVVPQSWGGPSVSTNMATLCPSGHRDVHVYLDMLILGAGSPPPWLRWRHFNTATRALAERGYEEAVAGGLTPKRTL